MFNKKLFLLILCSSLLSLGDEVVIVDLQRISLKAVNA